MKDFHLTLDELSMRIRTPYEAQQFLYTLEYVSEDSMRSAKKVWQEGKAHCLEAVHFAAALLERKGYPPLALSLDSEDNVCHVVYLFRGNKGWGSLGRSREAGLHGRAPVFKSIKDLALSYFDPYVDDTGNLIGFAQIDLDASRADWRYSDRNVWKSEKYILSQPHQKLQVSRARYNRARSHYLKGGHRVRDYWW